MQTCYLIVSLKSVSILDWTEDDQRTGQIKWKLQELPEPEWSDVDP